MTAEHFEILVEEPSMEAFLIELLPRIVGSRATFSLHAHQGKTDLIGKLEQKLRASARWIPETYRIVVVVDRDDDDCETLKGQLEQAAAVAGVLTRKQDQDGVWRLSNRIAIEELEAWYFGNWSAVREAYPGVSGRIPSQAAYRRSDAIRGGTWEALERILKKAGYFTGGLRKVELATQVGMRFDHGECSSPSFLAFRDVILGAIEAAP